MSAWITLRNRDAPTFAQHHYGDAEASVREPTREGACCEAHQNSFLPYEQGSLGWPLTPHVLPM